MKISDKKILVTGAGGFIGSHLTEKFVRLGAEVTALVYYNPMSNWGWLEKSPESIKRELKVVLGDIRDYSLLEKVIKKNEVIFHLASLIGIPYSYVSPDSYLNTNTKGTLNLLLAARNYSIEKFVHTSTSEVYGSALYTPIDEKHPLQPQSPYAASKIAADKLVESFNKSFNMPTCIIRPFNTYGPRQSARAVIPTIVSQALTKEKIKLGSLHPIRDFNFIDDITNGFIKIAERDEVIGETINIGSGIGYSIEQLLKKIFQITGKKKRIAFESERERPAKSEVSKLIADNTKARQLLGWTPKIDIDKGLKKTVDWMSKNLKYYKVNTYNI